MLKRLLGVFVTSFLITCNFITIVNAAECTYTDEAELNAIAGNVKINNEIITEKEEFVDMTVDVEKFKITLLNITEEIYVVVENDKGMESKTYTYQDTTNGEVSFIWENTNEIASFTATVYASNNSNCGGKKLRTHYLSTPRFNEFSKRDICNDEDMKDFYLCQKYVMFSEVDNESFVKRVESFINGDIGNNGEEVPDKVTFMDQVFKFLDDYKWYIIGGVIVIGAAGGYIYYRKSKKQREFGL